MLLGKSEMPRSRMMMKMKKMPAQSQKLRAEAKSRGCCCVLEDVDSLLRC